jgi:hypothetical protein
MSPINPMMDNMTVMFWAGRLLASGSWTGARSVGLADAAESEISAGGVGRDPMLILTSEFNRSTAITATMSTTNNLPVMFIQGFLHLPKSGITGYTI